MSFEEYANHISQKLKLAVSIAVIRGVPENLTTDNYIEQLKSNILDKMDSDFEISVCSDDFNLDDSNPDHNPVNNYNICHNNNHSDNNLINNTNLSNNYNEVLRNNSTDDNTNNDYDNCIRDNEIDDITLINDTQTETVTGKEEGDTYLKINDIRNDHISIDEIENDIFINDNYIPDLDKDYSDLIDKVLQSDNSQTILNNFCVYDIENTDGNMNLNYDKERNTKYRAEMSTQDTCNAKQTINYTQTLDLNDETYCESINDTGTQSTSKINQKPKVNENDRFIIMDASNTKKSNFKHDISIEEGPSSKRRKNVDTALKLQADRKIEDPNSRMKENISKFLDKNNIAKVTTEYVKVKDSLETVNKKIDSQNSTECTQTNTYSQSQPIFVIDQKYFNEKSKSSARIDKDLNLGIELTKKDRNRLPNDINTTNFNIKDIYQDTAHKNPIINETAVETILEVPNHKTDSMKIIENDTAFHFEREIYQFSRTLVCDARNNNILNEDIINESKDNRNDSNNMMNTTIIEDKVNNFNKKGDIINEANYSTNDNRNVANTKSTIDLTQDLLSQLSDQNYNNRNRDNSHRNNNNDVNYTVDSLSQQAQQINYNMDNNNRNRHNSIARNNNNNETADLTQNLSTENEKDEILNQSPNSDTDLTDSDEVTTEEVIPFKIVEELNKVKVYLNKIERVSDSSSDTGYKSDSQSRHSLKMSQSNVWLNQSAHTLFTYIASCPLISNTDEITRDISVVLAQLIQKLHEEEKYLPFMEELFDTVDSFLHSVLDENSKENECLKKDETMERILLLNKSIHIQRYTIDKITFILENLHTNLTTKEIYETENIQKIENSCYIFHILHIILQRYYKNQENLSKKQDSSQKSQLDSQKSQLSSQKSQLNSQKSQLSSQKSQFSSQKSQFSSQNSQEVLKKTDISEIWRKKWNPNFKDDKTEENFDRKCALIDCNKVLNKLIVSCMDGYSLIAYFALKCFNVMQSK